MLEKLIVLDERYFAVLYSALWLLLLLVAALWIQSWWRSRPRKNCRVMWRAPETDKTGYHTRWETRAWCEHKLETIEVEELAFYGDLRLIRNIETSWWRL